MPAIAEMSVAPEKPKQPKTLRKKEQIDPLDARITRIFNKEEAPPEDLDDAMTLIRVRFGCIFKALSPEHRSEPDLIREAAILSCGHELPFVPADARAEVLTEEFVIDLLNNDVPSWIVNSDPPDINPVAATIPEAVKASAVVQEAAARYDQRSREHLAEIMAKYPSRTEKARG